MKYLTIFLLLVPGMGMAQTRDTSINYFVNPQATARPDLLQDRGESALIDYIPPVACITYGFLALNNRALKHIDHSVYRDMREDNPNFSTHMDNYLQYSPAVAAGFLNIAGIKGRNRLADQGLLYFFSSAIMSTSVTFFKRITHQLRPNGTSYSSFPSGHTATAFAAAEFLNREFSDRSAWYGIAAYSAATATGILRVYNNAHWFSNVIAGAGFGILSTKAAYLLYPHLRRIACNSERTKISPFYYKGSTGLSLTVSF